MIINNYFKVRKLVLAGALVTSLSLATHAAAESSYLIDLNTMTATPLGVYPVKAPMLLASMIPGRWWDGRLGGPQVIDTPSSPVRMDLA